MKKTYLLLGMLGLITIIIQSVFGLVQAATTFNQTISIQVQVVTELTVSGSPAALIVNSATAGSQPISAINSVTTYNLSTNEASKKITGVLNGLMPANTSLVINLAAPSGATSAGDVTLTDTAADLVTGISHVATSQMITYKFSSQVAAGIISSSSRSVTLTVTN